MIWPHASRQNPCPICNGTDWCSFGDKAMLCRRVESQHPHHPAGGWYHFYESARPEYIPSSKPPPRRLSSVDVASTMMRWATNTPHAKMVEVSAELGVSENSLEWLDACWADEKDAMAFPMCDGNGQMIGVRLRNSQGFKWAMPGSRSGVFFPLTEPQEVAYLPEGPTDTAALLTLGLWAVGRPTCNSGNDIVGQALQAHGVRRAVVVADNDEMKRLGPRAGRPGIEGAQRLKAELGIKSVIWIPPSPCKDARDFLRRGGTRQMIESDLRNKLWTKG